MPIYTIGNHDESRIATRVGRAAARTAAMMLLTLPGLPIMYYGDELGMADVEVPDAESRDLFAGKGNNRDSQRTPMQWDSSASAGFSSGKPWLPVAKDYVQHNVEKQVVDKASMLQLYKQLIGLRQQLPALHSGEYRSIDVDADIFSYERSYAQSKLLILLNFTSATKQIRISGLRGVKKLSTYLDTQDEIITKIIRLRSHEGLIVEVTKE